MTILKGGPKVIVLHTDDQVFCFTDSNGCEWHWNAGAALSVDCIAAEVLTYFGGK